ncbi:hypothetical protein VTO42DRAFT_5913 [Malbranchea cinnamomea]
MLFPCYAFNNAVYFQKLTEFLAYSYPSHITERNPTDLHQLHLPARVIPQLNEAKGRLRTFLHKDLFRHVSRILEKADCKCKEDSVFYYLRKLQRIRV